MTLHGRSSRWAVGLALGLAGLIGVGAATVHAAPAARTVASPFELTVDGRDTWEMDGGVLLGVDLQWTFKSRAPFCTKGTFVEFGGPGGTTWRFTCDDGTGGLTVSIARAWNHDPRASVWNTTWRILDGSGTYAGLRGVGSMRIAVLSSEISDRRSVMTWRSTLEGVVERDAVAPTIAFSRATATKLPRPAGAYALRLALALHDDVEGNPVSYTLRVTTPRGTELARKFGTATKPTLPLRLRINLRSARARAVWLRLDAEDPMGNPSSLTRRLALPR